MNTEQKIKSLSWKPWLERQFSPFVLSLFQSGIQEEFFRRIGVPGVECKAILQQQDTWYESQEVWDDMVAKLTPYMKKYSIFDVTRSLGRFYNQKKKRINAIAKQEGQPVKQLEEIYDIITTVTTYIWLAHGIEEFYKIKLNQEVPKYVKGDVEKFIGDASFPTKKNVHALMEDAIRKGIPAKTIAKRFGWLKARDIDLDAFSEDDIRAMKKELKQQKKHSKAKIPRQLSGLFRELSELVFFRTARTDVFYEFIYLSRPVFRRVAGFYNIPYPELKYYPVQTLISGKPKMYRQGSTLACYGNDYIFSEEPLIVKDEIKEADSVKGVVAFIGLARGIVRIVKNTSELEKVKQGDILVTQMTFPAFMPAMARAVAFVTDEGGITCHAAIVAREMKKPCVMGTKIATKIFKDGDMIEVDANKGIVTNSRNLSFFHI